MVASDTGRLGIIKRAKFVSAPPIIRYRDVRPAICAYLSDDVRSVNPLISAELKFQQQSDDPSFSSLMQDDAKKSIEVLHSIQQMNNKVSAFTFRPMQKDQPKLSISEVEVSVVGDLFVHAVVKKIPHVGIGVLRFNQGEADTEAAIKKREEMGRYVATVAQRHLTQNIKPNLPISNKLCMSIDIQHGDIFCAPDANARRMADIENACRFIKAMWPSITQ